ncbi:amidohydrolase [Puniceibacterium sp. HSS470]|mgnify:CR=1 FL=1|jgi:predicted amidohydrolase YtcJ|nr:amidohydrolase [Puniceibacterium sp. HSS470]|tara:strand:- start:34077 stop:35639 length:1563 start_codon:yes stop_codon:yes gene_type:complete
MSHLLYNARIHRTAFDDDPADAILIRDGVVAWVGTRAEAPAADTATDLNGRSVLPGLTDAHVHLFALALSRLQISFARQPVSSIEELVTLLQGAPGEWIQASDLMEDRLVEGRLPTAADLDLSFPDRPVLLRRYCGHVAVLNTAAMQALGLAADMPDPASGVFHRDAEGRLTGIAEETAAEWVFARAPAPSDAELAQGILDVMHECLSFGLTALTEAAVGFSIGYDREASVWAHLRAHHEIPVRMGFMLQLDPEQAAHRGLLPAPSADWSVETLKYFADGIIGGRSGALSEPYDDTGGLGVLMQPTDALEDSFARTHADGWRIAVHATGDRGIARVTTAIAAAQGENRDRRHRIEHCFVPPDGLFDELAEQGIVTVTQPGFLHRMGGSIARGLGARAQRAYPAASILRAGAALAFSSDAPTGPLSPWDGMQAAMTRTGHHGGQIGAAEAVSFAQALDAYIAGGAYAMRQEDMRGTLAPGMAADLVVLRDDPFALAPDDLPGLRADLCMVAGQVTHRAGPA